MEYRWNVEAMGEVFALPAAVVDKHIRLAGSAQLKVLLWLSRAGGGVFDPDSCGKAIGLSAADCTDALQYWMETGILVPADTCAGPAANPAPAPASSPAAPPRKRLSRRPLPQSPARNNFPHVLPLWSCKPGGGMVQYL